ncbi:MAG: GTPase HflX, partial [Isosphaeraceae bacterium]
MITENGNKRRERCILVGVLLHHGVYNPDDPLDEIRGLAETAGLTVLASLMQKRAYVDVATYLGKGKVEELKNLVEAHEADLIVSDNDLAPSQTRNLEKALGVKVIDRTEVILDIFASRARTHESHLQVELAQLEYALPRLKRMWTHLSRYKGGIGVRGPGEKQLEEDRRLVVHRIQDLKAKLGKVQARKEREVASRGEVPTISLVGYTNAGKSTLMNALTEAEVLAEDKLFATLDTRTRKWRFKGGGFALLSDTVGFIRDLPHSLVASFKATLEEARQA